jgi:4-alpha-glucanotransferase
MRDTGFKLLRARVHRARALYDLIRVDHAVGLYRTFNFGADPDAPGTFTPADENEQRAQGDEIMRTILNEAGIGDGGGAAIIAEDLGTVPPWVRQSLTQMNVPGYKVMQWERGNWGGPDETYLSPAVYPELSLATTGTHDTESLTTWWREQPIAERE